MVQYMTARLDASFAALSDATRRGVLEQLGRADASITDLADKFHMTLTGMKKHVGVLEQAGLVTTREGRPRADLQARPRVDWRKKRRGSRATDQLWAARFDALDRVVEELKHKEKRDGRKRAIAARQGGTEIRPRAGRDANLRRPGAHRVRGLDQARALQTLVGAEVRRACLCFPARWMCASAAATASRSAAMRRSRWPSSASISK